MEYMTVQQAAEKWDVAVRQVQNMCKKSKIPGAIRFSRAWAIPKDAEKPRDGRYKADIGKQASIIRSFQSLCGEQEIHAKIVEFFPYPIMVYQSDGTLILANEAWEKVFRAPGRDKFIGKYNILNDPNIEKWGVKDYILRAFRGETIQLNDMKVPLQDMIENYGEGELCFDSIFQNITCFPVYNDIHQLSCLVAVFITSRLFRGKDEILKGKEYIENHWQDKFNIDATAKASGLSVAYFTRIFKTHVGLTPHDYYLHIKISMIKEKLCDLNLSISQAFAECGMDYNSHYVKMFKNRVGTTPSEYRRNNS